MYVLQLYCTVSTDRSTLGSTFQSTEEVPVSSEKVLTHFLACTVASQLLATFSFLQVVPDLVYEAGSAIVKISISDGQPSNTIYF